MLLSSQGFFDYTNAAQAQEIGTLDSEPCPLFSIRSKSHVKMSHTHTHTHTHIYIYIYIYIYTGQLQFFE